MLQEGYAGRMPPDPFRSRMIAKADRGGTTLGVGVDNNTGGNKTVTSLY